MGERGLVVVALLFVVMLPAPVAAQVPAPNTPVPAPVPVPGAPTHPTMPWGLGPAVPYGQLIRYVWIPPQEVLLEAIEPGVPVSSSPPVESAAAGARLAAATARPSAPSTPTEPPPARLIRQVVVVPGFYVRETTVGYHYPRRWAIEQVAAGTYRWRLLPEQFRTR